MPPLSQQFWPQRSCVLQNCKYHCIFSFWLEELFLSFQEPGQQKKLFQTNDNKSWLETNELRHYYLLLTLWIGRHPLGRDSPFCSPLCTPPPTLLLGFLLLFQTSPILRRAPDTFDTRWGANNLGEYPWCEKHNLSNSLSCGTTSLMRPTSLASRAIGFQPSLPNILSAFASPMIRAKCIELQPSGGTPSLKVSGERRQYLHLKPTLQRV